MAARDPYEVLGVARDASPEEIKRAYRKLALQHHPDRQEGEEAKARAEAVFKEASAAYAVLSDPEQRARYDRYGHAGVGRGGAGSGFQSVEDIFSAFGDVFSDAVFGDLLGRGGRRTGPRQGGHLQCEIAITLEEAAAGARRTITLDRPEPCEGCHGTGAKAGTSPQACPTCRGAGVVQQSQGFFMMRTSCPRCGGDGEIVAHPCPACRGRGRRVARKDLEVQIPAGVDDGARLRLPAQGEPGERGGPRGDLYCLIAVKEHPFFQRHESHLVCEVPVGFAQAALGATVEIPTLEGRGSLEVPRGTQPGEILRLKGRGMPDLRTGRRGDLLLHVVVEIPRKLTAEQEALLREYARVEGRHVGPRQKGFFDKLRAAFKDPGSEGKRQDG